MNDDHQMTRREYREHNELNGADSQSTIDSQTDLRTNYATGESNLDQSPLLSRHDGETEPLSRRDSLEQDKATLAEEKTQQLKKKLNKVIIGLVIAIVLVYLVLFFVG